MPPEVRVSWLPRLLPVLVLLACAPEATPDADGLGQLRVQLHDAPTVDADEVWVAFDGVRAHHVSDGWVTVATGAQSLDLLALQGGVVADLGSASLPTGDYDQLRLDLTDAWVVVDGATEPLDVPSGLQSGVKIPADFTLSDCGEVTLDLDWDVGAQLRHTKQGYSLRPTVKAEVWVDDAACSACSGVVAIPDPALDAAIRAELGIPTGPLTGADLEQLTRLASWNDGVVSLAGLECATSLEQLELVNNPVASIAPLAGLPLTRLWLQGVNTVDDLSALTGNTTLTSLSLARAGLGSGVSDLTPLTSATGLTSLTISGHQVSDLSPLAGASGLTTLEAINNPVSDLSALAGKPLTRLWVQGISTVSDLGPLAGNTTLRQLDISSGATGFTPVTDLSVVATMADLDSFGASGHAITDASPLAPLPDLNNVYLLNNDVSDFSAFAGRCDLNRLWVIGNPHACPEPTLDVLLACGVDVRDGCP